MNALQQLAKNTIKPQDIAVNGELSYEQAERLISLVAEDGFLKHTSTIRMGSLSRNVSAFDITPRQLVRVAEGDKPTTSSGVDGKSSTLNALPVQLFAKVGLSYIRDNAHRPQFLKELDKSFAKTFQNDLSDLAFNGVSDDNSGSFLNLNKGWIQLAEEHSDSPKVTIDPANDGWRTSLKSVLDAQDERFKNKSVLVMNIADADSYAFELAQHLNGSAHLSGNPHRRFQGKKILTSAYMPQGKVLFTPPKNLVFGIHKNIRRDRMYDQDERVVKYTFDMAVDYAMVYASGLVLASAS